jgi:8-oxo-dGTP diphosphatase
MVQAGRVWLRLPKGALALVREVARHVLRRPVVGITAVCRTRDGRVLLIRRADTGTWACPGGTLEWGETLRTGLARELEEEAGVTNFALGRVLGVYSAPERDPRFHAVTVLVECTVDTPSKAPMNPLEILEVRAFDENALPTPLAMTNDDYLARARRGAVEAELE